LDENEGGTIMKYINRHIEKVVSKVAGMFPAMLLTGPRQVGKTTVLKRLFLDSAKYVTFDNKADLSMARKSQEIFFKQWTPPVILDEVQYAPNLFSEIKLIADNEKKKGSFYMTGSQAFHLMKNVSESLAGRIGILNMQGLSLREIDGCSFDLPFAPTEDYLKNAGNIRRNDEFWNVWQTIVRGSMPELQDQTIETDIYYASYINTYLERDVRDLKQIGDELQFLQFMTAAAAQTGNLLNYESLAKSVGVSANTIKQWISVLLTSGIIYLLPPYHNNVLKRAVKTPKLYFLDTGLVCHLVKWMTPEQAANGAMSGALLETFVIGEIIKSYYNAGTSRPPLYFYRDKDQNEIDLLIHKNGTLYPIEIKKTTSSPGRDISAFKQLDSIPDIKRGTGCLIAFADILRIIDEQNHLVPIGLV
jgi:predicted AAA+ superfamily ATPase